MAEHAAAVYVCLYIFQGPPHAETDIQERVYNQFAFCISLSVSWKGVRSKLILQFDAGKRALLPVIRRRRWVISRSEAWKWGMWRPWLRWKPLVVASSHTPAPLRWATKMAVCPCRISEALLSYHESILILWAATAWSAGKKCCFLLKNLHNSLNTGATQKC